LALGFDIGKREVGSFFAYLRIITVGPVEEKATDCDEVWAREE
jgi:hypothetical protein